MCEKTKTRARTITITSRNLITSRKMITSKTVSKITSRIDRNRRGRLWSSTTAKDYALTATPVIDPSRNRTLDHLRNPDRTSTLFLFFPHATFLWHSEGIHLSAKKNRAHRWVGSAKSVEFRTVYSGFLFRRAIARGIGPQRLLVDVLGRRFRHLDWRSDAGRSGRRHGADGGPAAAAGAHIAARAARIVVAAATATGVIPAAAAAIVATAAAAVVTGAIAMVPMEQAQAQETAATAAIATTAAIAVTTATRAVAAARVATAIAGVTITQPVDIVGRGRHRHHQNDTVHATSALERETAHEKRNRQRVGRTFRPICVDGATYPCRCRIHSIDNAGRVSG